MASLTVYSQPVNQVFEEWVTADGTQNYFIKAAVETDGDGFVYVAGATLNNAGNYDLLVSKYDAEGNVIWTDQYDGTGNGDDAAAALVVDANGYVFVTGTTFTSSTDTLDVVTIAYNDTGTRDWLSVYAGADELADFGTCIAVTNDAVYVGGSVTSTADGLDFLALKYRLTGTLDWDSQQDFDGLADVCTKLTVGDADIYLAGATNTTGFDWDMLTMNFDMSTGTFGSDATASGGSVGFAHVRAMDRDLDGNIYLTGTVANMSTGYDIHTVKIDTLMNVVWDVDYSSSGNRDDEGNALAIDPSNGNVYVGGFKDVSGQGTDFVTLMYNDAGTLQWSAMWNDTADGGDTVKALVVDANGNVTVTGSAWNGSSLDYHTVQYDDTGTLLWERSFNDKYNFTDAPMDIALTSDNGVVVTGQSLNPDSTWSYVTVKYLAHEFILPVDSDSVSTSLRWLANRDQLLDSDTNLVERVKFYSNQCYPNLYFMDDTLSYVFFQGVDTSNADTLHRIDMTFNGANADQKLLPMDKESYWNNYYLGHIPEGRPFVSLHDRLVKQEVWPNIDVVYSSNQRGLKYYIVVHPGGETGAISLEYHGYDALSVDGNEALVIESSIGELVQPQALAYEMDANGELSVLGWQPEYLVSGGEVTFDAIGSWTGDLVIEVNWGYRTTNSAATGNVEWCTYFGATKNDWILDMANSPQSNLYTCGKTFSNDFAQVLGITIGTFNSGGQDGFLAGFAPNDALEWFTYLGGSQNDAIQGVTFNDIATANKLYFVGYLESSDFAILPIVNPGNGSYYKTTSSGGKDAWFGRIDESTGTLQYSSYLGGSLSDDCKSVTCDFDGNVFMTGVTRSTNTPTTNSCMASTGNEFPLCESSTLNAYFQSSNHGNQDIFLVKLNVLNELKWSTFFGSNATDEVFEINFLDIPSNNNINPVYPGILICGRTAKSSSSSNACSGNVPGSDFPLCDPGSGAYFQANTGAFLSRFSLNGVLEWSTNFRNISEFQTVTSSQDYFYAVGITNTGTGGVTSCSPVNTNDEVAVCSANGGYSQSDEVDLYIAKFSKSSNALYWSTLYGTDANLRFSSVPWNSPDHYPKYLDAVATTDPSFDDYLYILGTTLTEFDYHLDGNLSTWYYQTQNLASGFPDAFLLGFSPTQGRKWSTLFGGGSTAASLSAYPYWADYGSATVIRNQTLYIGGYTGGSVGADQFDDAFPLEIQGGAYNHNGIGTLDNSFPNFDGFIAKFNAEDLLTVHEEDHPNLNAGLMVFPNPTEGEFEIIIPQGTPNCKVIVTDLSGQEVIGEINYNHLSYPIDARNLPNGMYLVKIILKNQVHVIKLAKQ